MGFKLVSSWAKKLADVTDAANHTSVALTKIVMHPEKDIETRKLLLNK